MKRSLSILLAVLAVACVIAALLRPVEYRVVTSFECAMHLEARESEPRRMIAERRRVCDAVERFFCNRISRVESFCAGHPELCADEAMVSNVLATCQMKVLDESGKATPIVEICVSAKAPSLACSLADFLLDDFRAWVEAQNRVAYDKNTAEDRVVIAEARCTGRNPDRARTERLASARKVFDRDRLKIRVMERPHVVSVQRVWQKLMEERR